MHIKFKELYLENFMSFGKASIELDNKGYTLVSGINNNPNDNSDSNGSGKSSIWEAISWVLTGTTIRGNKDVVNIHSKSGCLVTLSFEVNEDSYKITRTKDHSKLGSSLQILINNEDKSGKGVRDSEKLLLEYLPDVTVSLLGSVIILGQGLPQRFTNNTPSGRKEVLERLSKSDFMIDDIKNKLSLRKSVLQKELRDFEDKRLSLDVKIDSAELTIKDYEERLNSIGSIEVFDKALEELDKQISECKERLVSALSRYDISSKELDDLQSELTKCSDDKFIQQTELENKYKDILSKLNANLSEITTKGKLKAEEVDKLKNISDICPTCRQKIPNVQKPDYSKQEAELLKLRAEYSKIKKQYDDTNAEYVDLFNKLNDKFNVLRQEFSGKIRKKKEENSEYNVNYKELETKDSELIRERDKVLANKESYNSRISEYKNCINKTKTILCELNEEKLYIIKSIDEYTTRLDVVNKMMTLATRDFRGFLLSNVIDFINKKAKEYSNDIFGTDKIDFYLEGNNINISYDSKIFESLSGGEQQKINIIIQFALRDMLCQLCDFSSNILVLDEIFDNLDSIGCQKVLDLISNKLIDVDSVFIVTHHSDIQIPTDSEVKKKKNKDGISTIK